MPSFLPERGEAHLWYARTDVCCTPERLAYYRSLLSPDEAERFARFATEPLRHEYLLTRALCRLGLSRYDGRAPSEWRFSANEHGRPQIDSPGAPINLRFNLSNARSIVAAIFVRGIDAGVDVEHTARDSHIDEIAQRYFSSTEFASFQRLPPPLRRERFFALWTLKESYVKARGIGLSVGLQHFSFDLDRPPPLRVAFDAMVDDSEAAWQFGVAQPDPAHCMAFALKRGEGTDWRVHIGECVPDAAWACV
ncbi:MAG: 4'-phosphopantetheinyl transferase superfamily protein [Dokdonella sp.]|uniref:4'-phosphopantetheinyl transferase family protein n=1 Tax=Dokdonella sp. TaxID=2291710 RepID=UPI0032671E51